MRTSRRNGLPDLEEFKAMLQKRSLKATPQRLAVHRAMMTLEHASADMIRSEIDAEGGQKITVASVYNTLSQLSDKGIYNRISSPDNKTYYDICIHQHAHLFDTKNSEFINIVDEELRDVIVKHFRKRRFKGYSVDSVDIQLICHPTRSNRRK